MLLQIASNGLSKFSSYKNLSVDSLLMRSTQEQIAAAAMDGKLSRGEFMTIYKNYPDGKLTHTMTGSDMTRRCHSSIGSFPTALQRFSVTNAGVPFATSVDVNGRYFTARISLSWMDHGNYTVSRDLS